MSVTYMYVFITISFVFTFICYYYMIHVQNAVIYYVTLCIYDYCCLVTYRPTGPGAIVMYVYLIVCYKCKYAHVTEIKYLLTYLLTYNDLL